MSIIVSIYSFINILLEKIWFKLDYIWSHRYTWIKTFNLKSFIDIWANKGQTIEKYKTIFWKDIHFYSFEPLQSAFSILKKKFSNDPSITLFNIWLWNKEESLEINVFSHDDSSSILNAGSSGKDIYHYHKNTSETILVKTLDSVFASENTWPCIMKIDVQWFELRVLEWWEQFLIWNVKVLILELSFLELYEGQELFWDIYSRLSSKGFIYQWALEQAWNPSDGKPVQQDAIFVNKNL